METNDDKVSLVGARQPKNFDHIIKILKTLGFSLDEHQPHISGERYLMTRGREKFVLLGTQDATGTKIVIKISSHPEGKKEIETEKYARDLLASVSFAKNTLNLPEELYFGVHNGYLLWVTKFVPQDIVFAAHPLEEQFFLALKAFEAQEEFHATTAEHMSTVKHVFPVVTGKNYLDTFDSFQNTILKYCRDEELSNTLNQAKKLLTSNESAIDRYGRHLTHTDFVPHNFRIKDRNIFMLDCAALYFGNKYEGWARFLNYMVIHSPKLELLLNKYLQDNRNQEEYLSLRLMRIFKTAELLNYYAQSLNKTEGDLHVLTKVRIDFWHEVLKSLLNNEHLDKQIIENYTATRNSLRTPEETERQKEFNLI